MYEINVTDFLTFYVIVVFNTVSYFQFRAFNDITKISSELVFSNNLGWPQNGTPLVCTSILCALFQIIWTISIVNYLSEISYNCFIWLIVTFTLNYALTFVIILNLLIFYISWMEHFSIKCGETIYDIIQHSKKCLNIYQSIQDGVGLTCCRYFLSFQIIIVISLYMGISTAYFAPYDLNTNIIAAIFFGLFFLYCGIILYVLTIAGENAYNSLQNMIKPLNIMAKKEKDEDRRANAQLMIDEIKTVPPLNGNGYFVLKKDTLTSIASTTVTYLIILLQFRNS